MLQLLDIPGLQFRRKLAKLTTMYKIINGNLITYSFQLPLSPIIVTQEMGILHNYNADQILINFLFSLQY